MDARATGCVVDEVDLAADGEKHGRPSSVVGRLCKAVSGFFVVGGLLGFFLLGHHSGWKFAVFGTQAERNLTPHISSGLAAVRIDPAPTASESAKENRIVIKFDSLEAVEKAGIDIVPTWEAPMTESVSGSGELVFDPAKVAKLSSRATGPVWRVLKTTGDSVKAGELLAVVDSAELGKVKGEFLKALVEARLRRQTYESLRSAGGVVPERQQREAEAAGKESEVRVTAARQALANLGVPVLNAEIWTLPLEDLVERVRLIGLPEVGVSERAAGEKSANLLPIRSPFDGVVLSADVVSGEIAEAGKALFVVVDPSVLWLTLHVGSSDAGRISAGQSVRFKPDGSEKEASGKLTWVGTASNETTRTVPTRALIENRSGEFRASTLGLGKVVIRDEPNALVVPNESVRTVEGESFVFVRHKDYLNPGGPKAFSPRRVTVGARNQEHTEILSGLTPSEIVATKGSGILFNELLRADTGSLLRHEKRVPNQPSTATKIGSKP